MHPTTVKAMRTISKLAGGVAIVGISVVIAMASSVGSAAARLSSPATPIGFALDPCPLPLPMDGPEQAASLVHPGAHSSDEPARTSGDLVVRARVAPAPAADHGFGCPIEHTNVEGR
jgi:hypothetical protein